MTLSTNVTANMIATGLVDLAVQFLGKMPAIEGVGWRTLLPFQESQRTTTPLSTARLLAAQLTLASFGFSGTSK